jgi:hypothetical protein
MKDNIVKTIGWAGDDVWQVAADIITLSKNQGLEPLLMMLSILDCR